jgi:F-box-like
MLCDNCNVVEIAPRQVVCLNRSSSYYIRLINFVGPFTSEPSIMAMAKSMPELPDEMLHEILSPVLNVPDEKFASTEEPSPFSSISQSSATLLLVCKRWLRVVYPLLYRTAVIRSSGQAYALASTLKAHNDLGKFIRKLRVEGGYGTAMHTILTFAPNITDLYLSLVIWSDDSVSGLCRSLATINPSRVILYDDKPGEAKFNAKARQLALRLSKCIPSWSNLVLHILFRILPY